MWKKTERAMDVMRERNRRYIESRKEEEKDGPENRGDPESDGPAPDECPLTAVTDDRARDETDPEKKAAAFHEDDDRMKLEKGDVPAMILSAILVFGPVFLVLFGILALAWLFLH